MLNRRNMLQGMAGMAAGAGTVMSAALDQRIYWQPLMLMLVEQPSV